MILHNGYARLQRVVRYVSILLYLHMSCHFWQHCSGMGQGLLLLWNGITSMRHIAPVQCQKGPDHEL